MCEECGCGDEPRTEIIPVETPILKENAKFAEHNREHLREKGVVAFNIMGSPGSGKTTLLERIAPFIVEKHGISVIEGDLATDNDAKRIGNAGITAHQINTGGGCHLDAKMVHHAMHELGFSDGDILFIENVGNLVCPADFDLGEDFRIVVLSVPEGDDKPLKYPPMFNRADLVVLSKTDLLPHLSFDTDSFRAGLRIVNPRAKVIEFSSVSGDGAEAVVRWIEWALERP